MKTIDIITELKQYINTLPEDDKKYIDYCMTNKVFNISCVGLSMLAGLLDRLQTDYKHEEAKKKGGNALKRQKIAEKVLKANQKENTRPALFKAFTEDINGESMQIFGTPYYLIAFNEEYRTETETHTPEELEKISFRLSKFFDNLKSYNYNKIDFDLSDIKMQLAQFKAEQKQRPAKERGNHHPVFKLGNTGYNAEYFIDIIEALGADAVFYQNENPSGMSYFEAESGKALLCPCRV